MPENLASTTETNALRQKMAYVLVGLGVILVSVGTFMILPAAGFIVAGFSSALYGYLLGAE